MAEKKPAAGAQSKNTTGGKSGANIKAEGKATNKAAAETGTKAATRTANTKTTDKNESTSRGKGSAGTDVEERWRNVPADDRKFLKKVGDKLSASTKRAKWIGSTEEHQDHKGQSLATRNHDVIRRWAEDRQAVPATVPGTEHEEHLGVLRFNFPGYGGDELQEVRWEQWFATFDERQLVFLYQENLKNGNQSNFFRFDNPYRENA